LIATAVTLAAGVVALEARSIEVGLDGGDFGLVVMGGTAAAALWAVIGVGLGALVRHQVAVIAGISIWLLFVENLLVSFVPDVGRLAPGAAGAALGGINPDDLLAPGFGAAVLAAYAVAVAAGGWVSLTTRDAG
jgi:hypothetical protein